jgi:hypothetical protein
MEILRKVWRFQAGLSEAVIKEDSYRQGRIWSRDLKKRYSVSVLMQWGKKGAYTKNKYHILWFSISLRRFYDWKKSGKTLTFRKGTACYGQISDWQIQCMVGTVYIGRCNPNCVTIDTLPWWPLNNSNAGVKQRLTLLCVTWTNVRKYDTYFLYMPLSYPIASKH